MVKPQQLQRFEDEKNWSIATTERPAHSPLYCSWRVNPPQLASAIALDSDGLRIMFFTLRDSTQTQKMVRCKVKGTLIFPPALGEALRANRVK